MLRFVLATLLCLVIPSAAAQAPIERRPPNPPALPSAPVPQHQQPATTLPAPQWTESYREPDPDSSALIGFGVGFAFEVGVGVAHGDSAAADLLVGTFFGLVGAFFAYHIPFIHHTVHYYQP
jgi:hypothetical protein